jgi:HAD superfamily hydrolase (TIGR01509 family)
MMLNNQAKPATNGSSLQAVIFDVDGTLADTERNGHRIAFNQAFDEFNLGWHWSPEAYAELLAVAGGKERIGLFIKIHAREMLGKSDLAAWIAHLYQRKSEIYSALVLAGDVPLRPGIARLITELRAAGVRLAIATTTAPSSLHSLITANFKCEMNSLFEVIGAGDMVANKKPAPDVYRWVLEQLELPPEACLAIEDSFIGLSAARAAGLPTVITISTYTADEDFTGSLSVVADLGEPDAPARYIGGLPLTGPCVDLPQLREWHKQHAEAAPQTAVPRTEFSS